MPQSVLSLPYAGCVHNSVHFNQISRSIPGAWPRPPVQSAVHDLNLVSGALSCANERRELLQTATAVKGFECVSNANTEERRGGQGERACKCGGVGKVQRRSARSDSGVTVNYYLVGMLGYLFIQDLSPDANLTQI